MLKRWPDKVMSVLPWWIASKSNGSAEVRM
jgi:hypothetical protein